MTEPITQYVPKNHNRSPSARCAEIKALTGHVTPRQPRALSPAGPRHELSVRALTALAAGPGDPGGLQTLANTRLSYTRSLVAHVSRIGATDTDAELSRAAAEGWALLCRLDRTHPGAVQEIFAHPFTSAWAHRCLRPPRGANGGLDRAHLGGLAAAAALRAGTSAEVLVPVRDGALHLPTLGAFRVMARAAVTATVSVAAGEARASGAVWQSARRVASPVIRTTLEDLDPFRDCQDWPAAARLASDEYSTWHRAVLAAGSRLAADVPGYAAVLGSGLRSIVPLRAVAAANRSSTARQAFGAVALTLPRGGDMAALLLHEFQHVKLHALTGICDLFDAAEARLLPVGWRGDPRPIEGVLHGTYAHLALAHLARAQGPPARARYLQYRSWVCDAAAALSASAALTSDGEYFVAEMAAAAQAQSDG
jgi:uncharacterized protein